MMSTILVAERFNQSRWLTAERYVNSDDEVSRWLDISARLGCFRRGNGIHRLKSVLPDGFKDWDACCNLMPPAPQSVPWDAKTADRVALELWQRPYDKWILIGRRVARAFHAHHLPYLEPTTFEDRTIVVAPHPSGLNRWWNTR